MDCGGEDVEAGTGGGKGGRASGTGEDHVAREDAEVIVMVDGGVERLEWWVGMNLRR